MFLSEIRKTQRLDAPLTCKRIRFAFGPRDADFTLRGKHMTRSYPSHAWDRQGQAAQYGLAVLLVAGAAAVRALLDPLLNDRAPYDFFLLAVAAVGLWCGRHPTLLALLLGGIAGDWFFSTPRHSFNETLSGLWLLASYFLAGLLILIITQARVAALRLANQDELTGLPNRRLLEDRLQQAIARAGRADSKVAVLLLDLDHFKEVNDRFGHRIGDSTLQQVATRLSSRLRESDTFARSGGDEFTIVSEVADASGARVLAAALEDAFAIPFKIDGKLIHIGVSVGVGVYPDDGSSPDELCLAADNAMYVAKRLHRVSTAHN
jgi:diguanylate cyclase (GGDEF)-like protein